MAKLSDRLSELRREKGWTQKELAEKIGIKPSTYTGWESEGKTPDCDTICRIAALYEVTTDYLLGYSNYRANIDEVFSEKNENFKNIYKNLPEAKKAPASELLSEVQDLIISVLSSDYAEDSIKAYTSLVNSLRGHREKVKECITNNNIEKFIEAQANARKIMDLTLDRVAKNEVERH